MERRKFLTRTGALAAVLGTGSLTLANKAKADRINKELEVSKIEDGEYQPVLAREVQAATIICIGAGNRGNAYSKYAQSHPEALKIIGVAEPIQERRTGYAAKYNIPADACLNTWEDVFKKPKWADAVLISTPDKLHYAPAMKAISMGYHVMLEKPISTSMQECEDIAKAAKKAGVMVAVCHVLRYGPYFKKLREIMASGVMGDVVSIDHFEPVGYWHMAHSYVRGNWRKESESSFMLLAKSCHDLDIMRWLVDKPCQEVASFGSLMHFKASNAPAGSNKRCTDGCAVEATCPYSAMRLYLKPERKGWPVTVITEDLSQEGRMKALKEGPYGRCVYHCDNDVVDHQVVQMKFEGGATGSFTMSAFSPEQGMGMRKTRVMGTRGYLEGDMKEFVITDFLTNKQTSYGSSELGGDAGSGHGGGDMGLIGSFADAVRGNNPKLLTSTIDVSVESHRMAFMAEKARLSKSVISL